MVTCQSSELGWEVTVELPEDFLSLGRGSVRMDSTLGAGASGVNCVVGMIYTWFWEEAAGSGLSLGWAMALGSKLIEIG